jgi:hypothetical protein
MNLNSEEEQSNLTSSSEFGVSFRGKNDLHREKSPS